MKATERRQYMNAAEHSTMVFLIQALQQAPKKAKQLLWLARNPSFEHSPRSLMFEMLLVRLEKVMDCQQQLLIECQTIREEMR